MDRAYSLFEVKDFSDEQRIIRGVATTPTPDRTGDIVDPLGITAMETIPLLLYHDSRMTVGTVRLGKPTKKGIPFEASIPKIIEPGSLKDRVDEAWQLVKYKLIAAVSIGFKPVYDKIEQLKTGGLRYKESEILELSLVPIPMNSEATITSIKSIDTQQRAASGESQKRVVKLITSPASRENQTAAIRAPVKLIPRTYENGKRTDHGSGKHPCGESRAHDRGNAKVD